MSWLERKYVNLVGRSLRNFHQKSDNLWNFSCNLCGDSTANKKKARAFIYEKKGSLIFHCHNCGLSLKFDNWLKQTNLVQYDEYRIEKFQINKTLDDQIASLKEKVAIANGTSYLGTLKKVSQLLPNHPCKNYIISRQIPTPYHSKLYYCSKFKKWTNSIIPEKFSEKSLQKDEPRLIIPLMDREGEMFGYQGRSLDPDDPIRYITIMTNETKPRLFGLDTVNLNEPYYIFEGPFDAMFIDNAIATCGGTLTREMEILNKNTSNAVVVYDNEPRNKDTVKKMLQAVRSGYKICIWPSSLDVKDVNDMVLKKVAGDYVKTEVVAKASKLIQKMIEENTYSGMSAELVISGWRKDK